MNTLAVQNPQHKCDLGNKNDSVTDKKITADNIWLLLLQLLYWDYIIYVCVHYNLHSQVLLV